MSNCPASGGPTTDASQIYPGARLLGDLVSQPNTCVGLGSENQSQCYDNGEFQAARTTDISGTGCRDPRGNYTLFGVPQPCRLIKYGAPDLQCALQNSQQYYCAPDGKTYTCDPDALELNPYTKTLGTKFVSLMSNYCTGDNLLNDPRCTRFCARFPTACKNNVEATCTGTNLDSSRCRAYCFTDANNFDCGPALKAHCAIPENQGKEICACHLPTEKYVEYYRQIFDPYSESGGKKNQVIQGYSQVPICSFPPCSSNPSVHPKGQKCTVTTQICVQNAISQVQGQVRDLAANINQSCNLGLELNPTKAPCTADSNCPAGLICNSGVCSSPIVPPDETPGGSSGTTTSGLSRTWIIILAVVGALILLSLIGVGVYLFMRNRRT